MVTARLASTVAVAVLAGPIAALWPGVASRLTAPAIESSRQCRPSPTDHHGVAVRAHLPHPPGGPTRLMVSWWVSGLVTVAAGGLTWRAYPVDLERGMLLLAWLTVVEVGALLAMIDVAVHRLPTALVAGMAAGVGMCAGLAAVTFREPGWMVIAALAAALLGGGYLLLALLTPSQVGMGDVRLAAVLAAALGMSGWGAVLLGAVLPYLFALPFAVVHLRRHGSSGAGQLPFGPFLVARCVIAALITAF